MAPKPESREHRFSFMMSDHERAMLAALADADHRSAGDWLRVAIIEGYRARFGDQKPKRRKR